MKNSIKTFALALTLTSVILTGSAFTSKASDNNQTTVLSAVKKVSKINVSGNVELILVQSADESVKVYNNYYAKNALVQQKDGELRISSFNNETLTVVVYVSNLTSITASNNSSVSTFGKFNALSLDVILKDQSTAKLNTNTINLSTDISGMANLTLSGSTIDYDAVLGSVAKLNMEQFASQNTNIKSRNVMVASVVAPAQLPTTDDLFNL